MYTNITEITMRPAHDQARLHRNKNNPNIRSSLC